MRIATPVEWSPAPLWSWPFAQISGEVFLLAAAILLTLATVAVFGIVLLRHGDRDSDGNAPSAEDDQEAC